MDFRPDTTTLVVHFAATTAAAIITAAGWAHLLALPNKIDMSRDDYLVAQQIYRGWALLGLVEFAALALSIYLSWLYRGSGAPFVLAIIAVASIALGLVNFFGFTYPANRATHEWTMLPDNWQVLRTQWEYSHAAGAILNVIALGSLVLAALLARTAR